MHAVALDKPSKAFREAEPRNSYSLLLSSPLVLLPSIFLFPLYSARAHRTGQGRESYDSTCLACFAGCTEWIVELLVGFLKTFLCSWNTLNGGGSVSKKSVH